MKLFKFLINHKQTLALITLNVVIFFSPITYDNTYFYYFSAWNLKTELFSPHQLITYQFLHINLAHLYFNMCFLGAFGLPLEKRVKSNFIYYYLIFGVVAGFFHLILDSSQLPLVGASGAITGIIVLSALTSKSILTKTFVCIFLIIELFYVISNQNDNTSHWCHLGGAFSAFCLYQLNKKNYEFRY